MIKLIGVSKTSHTTHDAKDIVVGGVDADFGGRGTRDGSSRDNKLKSSVINSGEVASSGWLVLFGAKGKRVNVDTGVWVSGVMLERLDEVEVGSFALGESVLTIKLELGGNNWILTPAVHVEGGLGEDESTGVRDTVVDTSVECTRDTSNSSGRKVRTSDISLTNGSWVIEETGSIDDRVV